MKYFTLIILLLSLGLFAGMLVLYVMGHVLRLRHLAAGSEREVSGAGIVEGAVFALLGLLLAFAFSGANSRFDDRRKLIVEEANAIGTAYLRLDVLAPAARDELRSGFRDYLDARLSAYRRLPDLEAANIEFARAEEMLQQIWSKAVIATSGTQHTTLLLLPALNQMFDIVIARRAAEHTHPPWEVFAMLAALCLLGAFLGGYAMGPSKRNWIHILTFSIALSSAFYLIVDLEYPRFGLIRVDAFDQFLIDVRQSMR